MKLVIDWEINCGTVALYRSCETGRSIVNLVFGWEINCGTKELHSNCEAGNQL